MLKDFYEPFLRMTATLVDDGMGGKRDGYASGEGFQAGISRNSSTEMKIAERNGAKALYTIVADVDVVLNQNDRVKRVADGVVYRITSGGIQTPAVAETQFVQYDAEVVSA